VKADVGGKLAQLGGRLIDSTAKKLADQFFENFTTVVGGPPPAAAGETASPDDAKKPGWFSRVILRKTDGDGT
jgi:hypothetical protein